MGAAAMPPDVVADAAAAVKAYLRLEGDGEAGVLARAAETALDVAEGFVGRTLILRAHEDVLPAGPRWCALAGTPVAAVQGVTALPAGGAPAVLDPADYAVDIDADGTGWIRIVDPGGAARVAAAYTAGLAAGWDGLPPAIAQGVTMLAASLFESGDGPTVPPAAVAALWRPWRRLRLRAEHHR